MKIYTKTGDEGRTSLMNQVGVSKCDDRIELLGTIDELSSQIGLAKAIASASVQERLSGIQRDLIRMMAGIAEPGNGKYRFTDEDISELEAVIDELEDSFPRPREFVLYGGCEKSARLDVARSVARRAERRFWKVEKAYGGDKYAVRYINRLSDYLYVEARYADEQDRICREVARQVRENIERMEQ